MTLIAHANLNDQVYEALKLRLVRRELRAGEKVSLHELAEEFGTSRSPVHHALTRLVSDGLLTVKSRRGYFVTPLTACAAIEGYGVRLALELYAAEAALPNLDDEKLARFRALCEASAEAVSHADWDAANAAFHEYQVDLAGNELLSSFYRDLSVNQMMQVIRGGRAEGADFLASEHAAIVDAYERRDLADASAAIRAHIESGRSIALDAIDAADGVL